jgi:hypothetical protein
MNLTMSGKKLIKLTVRSQLRRNQPLKSQPLNRELSRVKKRKNRLFHLLGSLKVPLMDKMALSTLRR